MFEKLSFAHILGVVLAASFVVGFSVFVLSGATTNKGTTGAIAAESATIVSAEKANCTTYGTYASIATLRRHGLLTFKPVYNSVVYVPGKHCGTIVVGSPAFQSPAG
jgi:malate/lactate dehydrogenase